MPLGATGVLENNLHWVWDIAFDEDHSRARTAFEAENLTVHSPHGPQHAQREASVKDSIKGKRQRAGWNNDYMLAAVLAAGTALN